MADDDGSSDWEKSSFRLSSSDEEKEDGDGNWIVIKNKKPKPTSDQEISEEGEGEEEDDESYRFYLSEITKELSGAGGEMEEDSEFFMKEMVNFHYPGLIDDDKFSVERTERFVFPRLPAQTLLRLRRASNRWHRLILSPFFTHIHALTARSLTGFFFHDRHGLPSFASLDDDSSDADADAEFLSISFLPETVHIMASNHGLLCCRSREVPYDYYIVNPMTRQWAILPPTVDDDHGPETAAVIVMKEPLTYNFEDDYFLVCAYAIGDGVYGFETFSSESWEWRKSNEIVAAEAVVPASGVAVAGTAYWRTTMQMVVAFDPVADACWEVLCPAPATVSAGGLWEIGEMGRKLCAVVVGTYKTASVSVLEDRCWKEVGVVEVAAAGVVVPLRAQGEREVAVWSDKAVTATDMELRTVRRSETPKEADHCADFLPYVSSLVLVKGYG